MICQEDLYVDVGRAAMPATAVRHTITTSPLEFLDSGRPLPTMLAGVRRNPSPDATDLFEIVARHKGERPRAVELTGDDVAFMVHTSGTTGDAKGAMNTHRNVVFATSVYEAWIGLTSNDVILGLAPLFHVTGLIGHVTLAMLTGSPLVLFYRFDVNEACRLAALHRATFTVSAITAYIALLNSDALARLLQQGVELRRYSDEILSAARQATAEIMGEEAAKDAMYRKVYESWQKARDSAFQWFNTAEVAYAQFAFGGRG
jgi:long-chain acyl-CoA synthetase